MMNDAHAIMLRGILCSSQAKRITWTDGFTDDFVMTWDGLAPSIREHWRTMANLLYVGHTGVSGGIDGDF
jgi:hypothetical protein